jgi:hypothetical protein
MDRRPVEPFRVPTDMIMEEITHIPNGKRKGPLIVHERTGLPYAGQAFLDRWHADFKAARPHGLWNRDVRAGGVTEGGKSGALKDDRRKVAGHAREGTTEIYDRNNLRHISVS